MILHWKKYKITICADSEVLFSLDFDKEGVDCIELQTAIKIVSMTSSQLIQRHWKSMK